MISYFNGGFLNSIFLRWLLLRICIIVFGGGVFRASSPRAPAEKVSLLYPWLSCLVVKLNSIPNIIPLQVCGRRVGTFSSRRVHRRRLIHIPTCGRVGEGFTHSSPTATVPYLVAGNVPGNFRKQAGVYPFAVCRCSPASLRTKLGISKIFFRAWP